MQVSIPELSPREHEVAGMIVMGKSNKKIADALGIATTTVKIHVKNIMSKYGIVSRHLLAGAMAKGEA